MGLLNRAVAQSNTTAVRGAAKGAAKGAAPQTLLDFIADFQHESHLFHCIVIQANGKDIAGMMAGHDAACASLLGGKCLVLLPGALDRELFAHRLSKSAGSLVLFQTSANEPSAAFKQLRPYLR